LSGGYESPFMQKFVTLSRKIFESEADNNGKKKAKTRPKGKK
jgi:hypothetical protein